MRFLDLAVAGLIGLSAIAVTYASTPQGSDLTTHRLALESHLRDRLLNVMSQRGLSWFLDSTTSDVCNAVASLSNSSVTFTAIVDYKDCLGPGSGGSIEANLTARTPSRTVVLVAWVNG